MTNIETTPLRVLRIITTIEPEVGGPSHSAVNAAAAEQSDAVTTTLVSTHAPSGGPVTSNRLSAAGVRHVQFPRVRVARDIARRWGLSWRLPAWVFYHARSFDVIHVHYVWSVGTLVGVLAGAFWRRPVVMTPHESLTAFDIQTSRSAARRLQKMICRQVILSGVDQLVVASELERHDSGPSASNAVVIAHPVVVETRARQPTAPTGVTTIGYLGRLHPKKRVGVLLDAFEELPESVRLLVAGGEPESELRRLKERVAASPYAERVEFLGFLSDCERDSFFDAIDLLAMPSVYECFGMVAAEAMSAGVPVVVTETTGIAAVVSAHGAGRVVTGSDNRTLTAALDELTSSADLRAQLGINASRASEAELTFAAYGRSIFTVYNLLAQGRTDT